MRTKARANGISVHAISGTHCIMLAMDAEPAARQGLLGFAIRTENPGENNGRWLRGFKFFESIVPDPQPGERRSTLEHPIQSFLWGHYSAKPGKAFRYTIRPMYGTPGNLTSGQDVVVDINTEKTDMGTHAIFFNRELSPTSTLVDGHRLFLDKDDSMGLSIDGEYEPIETQLLTTLIKPGFVVIDIGANIG